MTFSFPEGPWKNYGRWKQPPLSGCFWTHWHEAESAKEITAGGPLPAIIFLDGYHLTRTADDQAVMDYAVMLYDTGALGDFYERFEHASSTAEKRHLALLDAPHLSDIEYLTELFDSYLEMVGTWGFLFRFSSALEDIARVRGLATTDDEILLKMKPYVRTTWLEQQTTEIHNLARELKEACSGKVPDRLSFDFLSQHPAIAEEIRNHVARFAWFGTHHWEGDGYSVEKCVTDIEDTLRKGSEVRQETVSDANAVDSNVLWKLIASSAYWRTHAAETTAKVVFSARERLTEIARRWDMTYTDLTYLSSLEIVVAQKENPYRIQLPENYAERRMGYGCIIESGVERIFTGAELTETIERAIPKVDTTVSELKGTLASKGGVLTGIARVILAPADFSRFNDGEILVANETTPDFVPLMKKAAAIVTDTGGITSHAAIVSRELKKPCIIGTKIGTQVIKDGMQIEVNAETGIIKILS